MLNSLRYRSEKTLDFDVVLVSDANFTCIAFCHDEVFSHEIVNLSPAILILVTISRSKKVLAFLTKG